MKYLSLAAFAQRVIDALIQFVDEGKLEGLEKYVPEAISSLQAVPGTVQVQGVKNRPVRFYEQVRTITEIAPDDQELKEIIAALNRLLEPGHTKRQRIADAKKAITFFHRVENQALLNCHRPDKPLPKGLHQLLAAR
jgi:hypothetical protein